LLIQIKEIKSMFNLFFQISYANEKQMNYTKNKLAESNGLRETPLVNNYSGIV
jgi:hypothetical protein